MAKGTKRALTQHPFTKSRKSAIPVPKSQQRGIDGMGKVVAKAAVVKAPDRPM